MEAELLQLAREAVGALQLQASGPGWVEVAQLIFSGVGLGCIVAGLFQMKASGNRRDKEIDELGKGLRQQGEMMTEALQGLRQQGDVLGKIGQALTQQSQAMTQAFTQQGQALERQGEVLAELLRRTA